jgi:uncharacterized protein
MTFSEMHFTNQQIDTTTLPSIGDLDFKGLHKDYLLAELIFIAILMGVISIGVSGVLFVKSDEIPNWILILAITVLISLIALILSVTWFGFKRKMYALRNHDIIYKEGLLFRATTMIPFSRVQHVEVNQGPIERLFGLSTLNLYTAGGSSSDLSISGILLEEANRMKYFILNKTIEDEEE